MVRHEIVSIIFVFEVNRVVFGYLQDEPLNRVPLESLRMTEATSQQPKRRA